jgi:nicotinamidase-related amidase
MTSNLSVFGLISVISLLMAAPAQTRTGQNAAINLSRTALVIIDIQNFYFEGGKVPLTGSVEASLQAKKLLEAFRAKKGPVIHVKHVPANPAGLENDPAYAIHPNVAPAPGEKVIVKHYANAFRETELRDYLKQRGIQQLVICGMQTQMCVEAATRAAADFGFTVIVAHDACATRPLNFNGADVPAAQVHAAALATMNGTYAKVLKTDDVLAALR